MTESKFWIIKKYYDNEETREGFFQIKLHPIAMTVKDFLRDYEITAPLCSYDGYNSDSICVGVKEASWLFHNINAVASELFNTTLCGDVVFTFEDAEDETKCIPLMRKQLIELGMNPEHITLE